MRKPPTPKLATKPPRLTPLVGRASPKGSSNFGGLHKGIDMPNQASSAKYKNDTPQKGNISFGVDPELLK
jgi:hypothetical protein